MRVPGNNSSVTIHNTPSVVFFKKSGNVPLLDAHHDSLLCCILSVGIDELLCVDLDVIKPISTTWDIGWCRYFLVHIHTVILSEIEEDFFVSGLVWHCG